jgi:hypothetical protein
MKNTLPVRKKMGQKFERILNTYENTNVILFSTQKLKISMNKSKKYSEV